MNKVFIFDLDGTLVDTLADIYKCLNIVLERNGFPSISFRSCKRFIGNGAGALVRQALGAGVSDEICASVLRQYSDLYNAHPAEESKPYPGIAEILTKLKDGGWKLAVLSNKPDVTTKLVVKACLPEIEFDVVRGHVEGVPHKPDPTSALQIMSELDADKSRTWFVGDSQTDIQTARNAGIRCASVTWGYRTMDELEASGQVYFCSKASDLLLFAKGLKNGLEKPIVPVVTQKPAEKDPLSLFGVFPTYVDAGTVDPGENVCSFTGHRPEKLGISGETDAKCISLMMCLENEVRKAIDDGFTAFMTGMADGVDIWAAMSVIRVRNEMRKAGDSRFAAIHLYAALPYRNFNGRGFNWQKERYAEILRQCSHVFVMCEEYTPDCMRRRNEFMVNSSNRLIAVTNGSPGGTAMTIGMAEKKGIDIRLIRC